jgi:hypothetical protein
LQRLLAAGEGQVWAEGEARQKLAQVEITARDRTSLEPGEGLVIWTIPPGRGELQAALSVVSPQTVYLFADEAETGELEPFLKRLVGLVKYALNSKQGRVSLAALAAGAAQSESAVRAGLAWMLSRGHIVILAQAGEEWLLEAGDGAEKPDAAERLDRVKKALEETAAFRAYYQRADAETLARFTA